MKRAIAALIAALGPALAATTISPQVATATDPCGATLKKSDGSRWTCTFSDNFDGPTLNRSNWLPQTNFAMGTQAAHACFADNPSYVAVSGGSLNLTVRKVTKSVSCAFGGMSGATKYVSGGVM